MVHDVVGGITEGMIHYRAERHQRDPSTTVSRLVELVAVCI